VTPIVACGPRDVPEVALTFDDGPGTVTPAVLDVLRSRGARATFDVLGSRVRCGRALVRRAVAEGHEIGVHGWRHRDLAGTPVRAWAELARAMAAIREVAAVRPRVFRPPFGDASVALALAARTLGLVTVTWDVDPRDFEEPGAERVAARVCAGVRPGSIVLLHDDRPGLAATAEALPAILDHLFARGLAAVTISRLLGLDGPSRRA
jgi:peptidoglycan-N-acetylglucosamine deacetylase